MKNNCRPLWGQKRSFGAFLNDVRFTPDEQTSPSASIRSEKCQEETHAPQQLPALFDHLAGAQQERFPYREAERLGGFEIDD
jgi:hypothetical protein